MDWGWGCWLVMGEVFTIGFVVGGSTVFLLFREELMDELRGWKEVIEECQALRDTNKELSRLVEKLDRSQGIQDHI